MNSRKPSKNVAEFYAKDRSAWRQWLMTNHETMDAVWLTFDKGDQRTMKWEDIVCEALCFGWVDSKPGKVSETQSKIYVCRRNPKSTWSKINKEHVARLSAEGLIMPSGQRAIEQAQKNGAWDALNASDDLIIPDDLQKLFDENKIAYQNYSAFSKSAKRAILSWIYDAKRPETRTKRIQETVRLSVQNIKAR